MRSFILALLFISTALTSKAQQDFNYNDFFHYRNHQYLQTSNALLNGATAKMATRDTAAAIKLIQLAATKGMYDTGYITYRGSLNFVTKTPAWEGIKQTIRSNAEKYSDPEKMEIITSDIDKFWSLYDKLDDPNADEILMNEYIMKGSQGLKTFFEVRLSWRASQLITAVRDYGKYYESIRETSLSLKNYIPTIKAAAAKLKTIYPESIFPPTTFFIGNINNFGTADGGAGQLIGAEFLCDLKTADTSQLNRWQKSALTDTSKILGIIIHELIHIEQQTASPDNLLARAINEGAADFVSELVLGFNLNSRIHAYGNANEKALWEKFKKQMDGTKTDDWLYNGLDDKRGYPADLGYYMGYKICEAYYNKAQDKKQAVKDILTIQDFEKFLSDSGYNGTI